MCGGFVVALQIPSNTPCFALFHSALVVPGEVVYESAGVERSIQWTTRHVQER
jgi:hypothetical protein